MGKATFPTLLDKKATMLGSLTRYDLVFVGMAYLILSWMKVSGIYSLIINACLLVALKLCKKYFNKGFYQHLNDEKQLKWSYKLEELNG